MRDNGDRMGQYGWISKGRRDRFRAPDTGLGSLPMCMLARGGGTSSLPMCSQAQDGGTNSHALCPLAQGRRQTPCPYALQHWARVLVPLPAGTGSLPMCPSALDGGIGSSPLSIRIGRRDGVRSPFPSAWSSFVHLEGIMQAHQGHLVIRGAPTGHNAGTHGAPGHMWCTPKAPREEREESMCGQGGAHLVRQWHGRGRHLPGTFGLLVPRVACVDSSPCSGWRMRCCMYVQE